MREVTNGVPAATNGGRGMINSSGEAAMRENAAPGLFLIPPRRWCGRGNLDTECLSLYGSPENANQHSQ
jgi:hypothetical protein